MGARPGQHSEGAQQVGHRQDVVMMLRFPQVVLVGGLSRRRDARTELVRQEVRVE